MRRHSPSCRKCKNAVLAAVRQHVGDVQPNHNLRIPARLDDYSETLLYPVLRRIWNILTSYRGHSRLVVRRHVPPVDYFVFDGQQIVEFDELQHFTAPRRLALSLYPDDLQVGFDLHRWMDLCSHWDRHDNSPVHRDEQRAWLDTLRDFWPQIMGGSPVIRLYALDEEWCRLPIADKRWRQHFID